MYTMSLPKRDPCNNKDKRKAFCFLFYDIIKLNHKDMRYGVTIADNENYKAHIT